MTEELHQVAIQILKSTHYITIATTDGVVPWNTPVSASFDNNLNFYWGSSPNSVHSKNIEINQNVFVIAFDSHQAEGTGVGLYMQGKARILEIENSDITKYIFVPEKIWINDEEKDENGNYRYDIRVEVNKLTLAAFQVLTQENFTHIFEWADTPNAVYEEHEHQDKVSMFIINGDLLFTYIGESTVHLKAGDRFDVILHKKHTAKVGPDGCRYVVGEMIEGDS